MECTITGYGWAGGLFRQAIVDGVYIAQWNGPTGTQRDSDDEFGHWGFSGPTPIAIPNEKLPSPNVVTFSIYGTSKTKPEGTHKWSAVGGAFTRSVIWEGSHETSVQTGGSIGWGPNDPLPSLTVHANNTEASGMRAVQSKSEGLRTSSQEGSWTLTYKEYCNSHGTETLIDGEHSHHWVCPSGSGSMNGGCGKHIQCKDFIPEWHKLQDKCPGNTTGPDGNCSVGPPYRMCTHKCEYYNPEDQPDPELVCIRRKYRNKCWIEDSNITHANFTYHKDHEVLECGEEDANDQNTSGCGDPYFTCSISDQFRHGVRICTKMRWTWIGKGLGGRKKVKKVCGMKFRFCTNNGRDSHVDKLRPHAGNLVTVLSGSSD